MSDTPDNPIITTYPEMDAKIVAMLRISDQLPMLYAAQRIEELEGALAERDAALRGLVQLREALRRLLDEATAADSGLRGADADMKNALTPRDRA
jgi:hypothetical protein